MVFRFAFYLIRGNIWSFDDNYLPLKGSGVCSILQCFRLALAFHRDFPDWFFLRIRRTKYSIFMYLIPCLTGEWHFGDFCYGEVAMSWGSRRGHFRSQIGPSWLGFFSRLFSRQLGSIISYEMKLWFFNDLLTVLGFWEWSKTVLFHSSHRVSFQLPPKNGSILPSCFSSLFTPGHVPYCRFVQIFGRGSNCIRRRWTAPIIVTLQVDHDDLVHQLKGLGPSPEALGPDLAFLLEKTLIECKDDDIHILIWCVLASE